MKKLLFILLTTISGLSLANAQGPGGPPPLNEKAKALRVGVYTRVLELTANEAKAFWPVFNTWDDGMEKLREEREAIREEIRRNFDSYSDKELEKEIDKMAAFRQRETDLWMNFYEEVKTVLPIKKVALLERAEREFKRELFQQLKERGRRF